MYPMCPTYIPKRKPINKRNKRRYKQALRTTTKVTGRSCDADHAPVITRLHGGFPNSMRTSLTYVQGITIHSTPGANAFSSWSFRANSIFDPDQTGVGHQPLGRDQWSLIYNHYLVQSSVIHCSFTPVEGTDVPVQVGVMLHEDGTLTSSALEGMCEQGNVVTRSAYPIAGFQPISIIHRFNAKTWFNKMGVNVYTTGASSGAVPTDVASFVVFMGSFTAAVTTEMAVTVHMTFRVLFTEPVELAQS